MFYILRVVIQPVLIMSQVQTEAQTAADPFTADAECPCTQVTLDESLKLEPASMQPS